MTMLSLNKKYNNSKNIKYKRKYKRWYNRNK